MSPALALILFGALLGCAGGFVLGSTVGIRRAKMHYIATKVAYEEMRDLAKTERDEAIAHQRHASETIKEMRAAAIESHKTLEEMQNDRVVVAYSRGAQDMKRAFTEGGYVIGVPIH